VVARRTVAQANMTYGINAPFTRAYAKNRCHWQVVASVERKEFGECAG
jgi:hypothetical protein